MTLYAADVMDIAKPVKKGKKKAEEIPTPPSSEPEVKEKPKRVLSDKQKEALKAGQERRKQKKLEEQKMKEEHQKQAAENEAAMIAKLEEKKAKRKAAAEERKKRKAESKESKDELDVAVQEVLEPKPKKQRKPKTPADPNTPPAWFQKYIEGVKREQADVSETKTPKKQIQQEAQEMAQEKWQDGMVRDRLRNELDGHANRMYSMIFGRR